MPFGSPTTEKKKLRGNSRRSPKANNLDVLTRKLDDMFLEEMFLDDLMKTPSVKEESGEEDGREGTTEAIVEKDDQVNLLGTFIYISREACAMYNDVSCTD